MPAHSHNYSVLLSSPPPWQKKTIGVGGGSCFHIQKTQMLPFYIPPSNTRQTHRHQEEQTKRSPFPFAPSRSFPSIQITPSHATNTPTDRRKGIYSPFLNPQVGLSAAIISSFVLTLSPGNLLTRCAPLRIACNCIADTPLRLLLILPASLIVS